MKCNSCFNQAEYTLGPDECGAGNTILICYKGHWENCPYIDYNVKENVWDDCTDYIKK
jgi:hypothetical protein